MPGLWIIKMTNERISEAEEEAALANAMRKRRKTALLNKTEKADFLRRLKQAQ